MLLVTAMSPFLRALERCASGARKERFGLFDGWSGILGGEAVTAVDCGESEDMAYAAVRQVLPLFPPSAVLYLSELVAVGENYGPGDLVYAASVRRCYCPVVVTDNMFPGGGTAVDPALESGDDLAFANEKIRRWVVEAPLLEVNASLLDLAVRKLSPVPTGTSLQPEVRTVSWGSARVQNWAGRSAEFLATRFEVEVVSPGAYGAVLAAADAGGVALLPVGVVVAGRSRAIAEDYRRAQKRYLSAAAELVEVLAGAAQNGYQVQQTR